MPPINGLAGLRKYICKCRGSPTWLPCGYVRNNGQTSFQQKGQPRRVAPTTQTPPNAKRPYPIPQTLYHAYTRTYKTKIYPPPPIASSQNALQHAVDTLESRFSASVPIFHPPTQKGLKHALNAHLYFLGHGIDLHSNIYPSGHGT
jgi:hypothetical protein